MQIGMIGLGRMGANMVRRLIRGGHHAVVYDRSAESVAKLVADGATGASTLDELVAQLHTPRIVWVMVPAGAPTEETVVALGERLGAGDVVIDGGNSYFKDDVRRARALRPKGIHYVDAGTSGGIWGIERGYCLMLGGEPAIIERLDPIFLTLAPGRGTVAPSPGREARASTADE
jgi:6-phosphogluconate dehydrogenase